MTEIVEGLVSTIIPVYNRPEMLRRAVDSVLAQTWRPIEVIVADDGSNDETRAVGEALASANPDVVRYFWNPNRGAGPAREAGRLQARGEFIQYLDSDDTLAANKFEWQVAALRREPECGIAYGAIRLCREGAAPGKLPHKWTGRALVHLFPALLVDRWWATHSPLWRRSVCDAIGPWTDLRYSQDWEYDARAGAMGLRLVHVPQFVGDQHHHEDERQTNRGRWLEPEQQVRFFELMFRHAQSAGVELKAPQMRHFARWVFLCARQCGARGANTASQRLFDLAKRASMSASFDMRLYGAFAKLVGWNRAGRWTTAALALSGRRPGSDTMKQTWSESISP